MHLDQIVNIHCTDTYKINKGRVVRMHSNGIDVELNDVILKFNKLKLAKMHIQKMINDGASFIDIGGESTRPGAKLISTEIEKQRVDLLNELKSESISKFILTFLMIFLFFV